MALTVATDLLAFISSEAALFGLALLAYLIFSGGFVALTGRKKKELGPQAAGHKAAAARPSASCQAKEPAALQPASKALRQGALGEAVSLLSQLPCEEQRSALAAMAPRILASAVDLAEGSDAASMLGNLVEHITPQALDVAIFEAQKRSGGSTAKCVRLDRLASALSIHKSQRTLELLAKAYASDMGALRGLMEQAGKPLSKSLAKLMLKACAATKDVDLVFDIFEHAAEEDAAELRAFAEQAAAAVAAGTEAPSAAGATSHAEHADEIRRCGKAGNLPGAVALFEQLQPVGGKSGALLASSLVGACLECGDLKAAATHLREAHQRGVADAGSINAVTKGLLAANEGAAAEQLLKELSDAGGQASQAAYHALLHARVLAGDRRGAWRVQENMAASGVAPHAVTCSILLKSITAPAHGTDLTRALELVDALDGAMDEVLLSSLLEACLRAGRLDMLSKALARSERRGISLALTAPMFGSMIKAFGLARDVDRVWTLWREMRSRGVQPTAITLGCMVEALVANRCADDAWGLVQECWEDESQQHLVNTVTYSTLLKGFSKQPDKIMVMYEEMRGRGIECNTITCNTILNVFAQSRAMHRVPQVLEHMRAATPPIEPDVVTYSTLIKGFCASGNLDRALGLLQEMEKEGRFLPDEMMYNSLLDGCAREHRLREALQLVDQMRKAGVKPSNYTLSMLVKLLGRCKKLGQAFAMVKDLTMEFRFRPNIQVYTCLIQACFHNRQAPKALALLDQILEDGLRPDEKTFTALVRGLLQMGLLDKAVQVVHRAYEADPPAGVDAHSVEEVVAKLGAGSQTAKVLLEVVRGARRGAAMPAGRMAAPTRPGAGAAGPAKALPPWRRGAVKHADHTSEGSTSAGCSGSGSEGGSADAGAQ